MQLVHLSLTNFRNFIRLETEIPPGATLLVGANAQGKTSLLESIYYLASASSPHAAHDRQLINFLALRQERPFARLSAEVRRGDRLQRIEIRIILEPSVAADDQRLHKEILINGVKRRGADLAAGINAVLFLPQDLRVIEGSPGDRRRYLDAVLSQADAAYAEALSEYAKVLSQRNALLKQLQDRNGNDEQMEFWDENLAEFGATLIRSRALALIEIERLAASIHGELSRGKETLRLDYLPAFDPAGHPEAQLGLPLHTPVDRTGIARTAIRDGMLQALRNCRREEIARGVTTLGPHRDEIRFAANGIDLRYYGSRGQNRTAMLSAKLAETEWLCSRTGEWPVLLLDEVLAELDAERRSDLLARVLTAPQALLTAADAEMFTSSFRQRANIWRIDAGQLLPAT
jgi:DNA replication and repair protein RecF